MIRIIKEFKGQEPVFEKATPKRYAQDYLASVIDGGLDTIPLDDLSPEMTEREKELVLEQIRKLASRMFKLLGYEVE